MEKRVKIEESLSHPPGWVVLSVKPAPATADLSVSIARRHPDRPHLSPSGWQAAPHAFMPRAVERADGIVDLVFGPEMTRHIGIDTTVSLVIPAAGIDERHFWPSVAASPDEGNVDLVLPKDPDPDQGGSGPKTRPSPPPPPPVNVDEGKTVAMAAEPGGRRRWLAGTLVLLLLVGGATGYLFWPPTVSAPPPPPAPPSFEARYQKYRIEGGHAEDLLSVGLEAMTAAQTDIGFRAITLAADRGLSAAKVTLGRWYDPLETGTSPVQRSGNVAAVYYSEAAATGDGGASANLSRLCASEPGTAGQGMQDFDKATHCP